ncbi:hypothetical protein SOVF_129570, partial [Spinacia oleracea]
HLFTFADTHYWDNITYNSVIIVVL